MESLLVVLLYMGAICSPCEYTSREIYMIEAARQVEVDAIESDAPLMDSIRIIFGLEADQVTVTDLIEES